jgi:hypothetical protein
MSRTNLLPSRDPQPLDLPQIGRLWIRVPTAGDAVESDGKGLGWSLVRFLCNEDGSPMFREDEEDMALRIPAWASTRIMEEVAALMRPPLDAGEARFDAPRPAPRVDVSDDGESDCHRVARLVGSG